MNQQPQKKPKFVIRAAVIIFLIVLGGSIMFVPLTAKAIPVEVIADAPGIWTWFRNKSATILFQNILRKALNEFAYDAGTYLGSGMKGQQATYIKEKYSRYLEKTGNMALGDFVESFASSVVADQAYKNIKEENATRCSSAMQECTKTKPLQQCNNDYDKCLANVDETQAGQQCRKSYNSCQEGCNQLPSGTAGPSVSEDSGCMQKCKTVYDGCNIDTNLTMERSRKRPMLGLRSPLGNVDLCNPSLDFRLRISLGLIDYSSQDYRSRTNCSFDKMVKSWKNYYDKIKDMKSDDYLKRLSSRFVNPTGSDLGASLTLYTNMIEYRGKTLQTEAVDYQANKGWKNPMNFAGEFIRPPGDPAERKKLTEQALVDNIGKVSGDILADAANIFLNQLALTAWRNLISTDKNAGGSLSFWNSRPLGRTSIKNKINKLKEQQYPDDTNFNLLAELYTCPPEITKPGPTNCVITSAFADGINGKKTVAQAIKERNLNGNWPFGFNERGEDKIKYNQGYPYRSILILRKYRVIPVGWELAAQKIQQKYKENDFATAEERGSGITLQNLVDCFDLNDSFTGYGEEPGQEWCRGLVDPYWVLKLPQQYCAAKGYGPILTQEPEAIKTGNKFCSKDGGSTRAKINGKITECTSNLDCCSKVELKKRDDLDLNLPSDKAALRKPCLATCDYDEQKITLARSNSYCADEQACIKKDDRGNCLFFGYCTKEKRKWIFDKTNKDKDCQPLFNSCQTFINKSNRRISLLQNTLDYGCSVGNVGCLEYSMDGRYDKRKDTVDWADDPSLNLDNEAENCRSKSEGCHEFIKLQQDGSGVNLIADSSFDDEENWDNSNDTSRDFGDIIDITDNPDNEDYVYSGNRSLRITGLEGIVYSPTNTSILPTGFDFELDRHYSLSAKIYVKSGEAEMGIGNTEIAGSWVKIKSDKVDQWEEYVLNINNDFSIDANSFYIQGTTSGSEFYIDSLKFEIGDYTNYSWYRSPDNLIYQKLLPSYLERDCYVNPPDNYNLKINAPKICQQFVRKCQKKEVGCELYTEVNSGDETAAKVKPKDICPGECVGFNTFVQQENYFYSPRQTYFIPKTAKTCQAQAEGCSLLVNLDKLKEGGESDEYYSKVRQCIKPENSCGDFYTWEGSDQSGYQLVAFSLKENKNIGSPFSQPESILDDDPTDNYDGSVCNEIIYSLPPTHPAYNPDCRQFYGTDGNVSYHLYSQTISCSDECYPYRLPEQNIDVTIDTKSECQTAVNYSGDWEGSSGYWDDDKQSCIRCLNGGTWMNEHQACVYYVMPEKSQKCGAQEVGCSEYVGNFGNNVKFIINDDFERGSSGWGEDVQVSSDALNRGGHSLMNSNLGDGVDNAMMKDVEGKIRKGYRYELSFMAKKNADNATISSIVFTAPSGGWVSNTFVKNQSLTTDWQLYKFDLDPSKEDEIKILKFIFGGAQNMSIRIDNVQLREFNDRHYLIKDSWQTPDSCNVDQNGDAYPLYMLGCQEYYNRDNKVSNLRSFSELCQLSAVGCQAMIDTKNSSYYGEKIYNDYNDNGSCDADEDGCLVIPSDSFEYIVYDKKKQCASEQKGCQRLGELSIYNYTYANTYKLNDPDKYDRILCTDKQVGCDEWTTKEGSQVYFKDPANRVCEFREGSDGKKDWYKKKMSYCSVVDNNGKATPDFDKACFRDTECDSSEKCILHDVDNLCEDSDKDYPNYALSPEVLPKTIGLGVEEDARQPTGMMFKDADGNSGYAGICAKADSSCTEYIDPESRFNANIIKPDNKVVIPVNTLYIVQAGDNDVNLINCLFDNKDTGSTKQLEVYTINSQNMLVHNTSFNVKAGYSEEFYAYRRGSDGEKAICTFDDSVNSVKEAVVAYKLKDSLNNEKLIETNFDNGQVLFNERSYNGLGIKNLLYNTKDSDYKAPTSDSTGPPINNNANVLLKVDPERECSEWLGCRSYNINPLNKNDTICYERGLCNQLNDAGQCMNFINTKKTGKIKEDNQRYLEYIDLSDTANMTGYAKAGYDGNLLYADDYPLAGMIQVGEPRIRFDGSFENTDDSGFIRKSKKNDRVTYKAPVISDARIIEAELGYASYNQVPDGQAIAKTKGQVFKRVSNLGGRSYVASAYVYLLHGSNVNLSIDFDRDRDRQEVPEACYFVNDDGTPACKPNTTYTVLDSTDKVRQWVRLSGKFNLDNYDSDVIRLTIWAGDSSVVYFDDVRIEPALNIQNRGDNIDRKEKYIHSNCRIYPERNSLSCNYSNESGLKKKGWAGYCLEFDPRDSNICLMWYPIDKVEAEEYDEGAALNFGKDIYYCIEAYDQCNAKIKVQPEMWCKTFIKVDSQKYWYDRLEEGSDYFISNSILGLGTNDVNIDFGVTSDTKIGGKIVGKDVITQDISGNSLYGAYTSLGDLGSSKLTSGIDGDNVLPYLPYYGNSFGALKPGEAGYSEANLCKASVDKDGNDWPFEWSNVTGSDNDGGYSGIKIGEHRKSSSVFDDCYVGIVTEWDTNDDSRGRNICDDWQDGVRGTTRSGDYGVDACNSDDNQTSEWMDCQNKPDTSDGTGKFICATQQYVNGPKKWRDWINNEPDTDCLVYQKEELDPNDINWYIGVKDTCVNTANFWTWLVGFLPDYIRRLVIGAATGCSATEGGPAGDGDSAGCFFDCYNHIEGYNVASSPEKAVDAVNQLFTGVDGCYRWREWTDINGDHAKYVPCDKNDKGDKDYEIGGVNSGYYYNDIRKKFKNLPSTAVDPEVFNVRSDQNTLKETATGEKFYLIRNSADTMIQFNSRVAPNQLPLRNYTIYFDYKVSAGGSEVKTGRSVNMYDRPDANNPHTIYYFLDYDEIKGNKSNNCFKRNTGVYTNFIKDDGTRINIGAYCVIKPYVIVTDNWGKTSAKWFIDHPIVFSVN